jgi:hypothetical protein
MPTTLVRSTLASELEAHREALHAFIATAQGLPAESWNVARAGDKWSPAQVSEHLRLTYSTVRAELAGGDGFRVRTRGWQQRLFRFLYLPRILRGGRFPKGVPATREIRPGAGPFDRDGLLEALRNEGEAFLQDASSAHGSGGGKVTHPFLGGMSILDGIRFTAQHIRHHHAQIDGGPRAAGSERVRTMEEGARATRD